ncbi:hypothetical protein [Streptomyces sp. NPDC055085]
MNKFTTAASGHAPGGLRDRFAELIESGDWRTSPEFFRLTGRLWNCTDTVPSYYCREVDEPTGSTYAQLSRTLRKFLAQEH